MAASVPSCTSAPTIRRGTLVLIPAAAFGAGLILAIGAARMSADPYYGVYRQEAVAVVAERSGRLLSIDLPHGADVETGDPLATFDDATAASRLDSLTADRERLQRSIDIKSAEAAVTIAAAVEATEKERLEMRLRCADLLRERLEVQLRKEALLRSQDAHDPPVAAMNRRAVWPVSAESKPIDRRIDLANAENQEEVLNTQIALCEDRLTELDRRLADLPRQIERSIDLSGLRSDLADCEAAIAAASQPKASVSRIISPVFGQIGLYRHKPGELVSAGETLVEIFDKQRPYVLLTVPISKMPVLTPGQRVRVEFEGFPTRKPCEGIVANVASEAERVADVAINPGTVSAQVRIEPVGRLWPVPPAGTTVRIDAEL